MWNYSFVLPTLMVLATLLTFYIVRPRLPIRLNNTFLRLIIIEILVVIFDLVSSFADENHEMFSPGVLYLLNTLFFVVFIARILYFYRFTVDALRLNTRRYPLLTLLGRLLFYTSELLCISSFMTGLVFRIENGMYQRGPMYDILYVCFFSYIILSLVLLCVLRRRLRTREFISAVAFNIVLFTGNIVRILLPRYLVMNTFCLVAIVIIYLAFLNPDIYMSDRGPTFNMRGFQDLLQELTRRKDYWVIVFAIRNYMHERGILGGRQMDDTITLISEYLNASFPGYVPFYLRSGRFAMASAGEVDCEAVCGAIQKRFAQPWRTKTAELTLDVAFAHLQSDCGLHNADRIINNLFIALEPTERYDSLSGNVVDSIGIQRIDQQVDIMRSLDQALENDQIEVFLQPVFYSADRTIAAAEALSRIRGDHGELIPPDMFIAIAEKSGYINRLGDQVLEKVCRFISEQDMDALGLKWINVNLSPLQCMRRDLPERFEAILKRCGVSADRIHLEITEQSMVDYTVLKRQVDALRDMGFQFVLDDYGSGYSNLTRIKHYPFINIKLDMEVVWDYFKHPDGLLPAILQGFREMGFSITAEGIETEAMAEALTAIGCEYLQGFLFSKPLPMPEFIQKYGTKTIADAAEDA